jgi:GWxTD domain-containing protein
MKMMNKIIVCLAILLFISNQDSYAQFYEQSRLSGSGNPFFNVQIFRSFAEDLKSGRVYVYSNIVNDDLTFIKNDSTGGFEAAVEWEVAVVDEDEEKQVGSQSMRKQVYESDYTQTNNRDKNILLSTYFDIPAGEYVVTIQMRDLMSRKIVSRKIEIEMYDFEADGIDMSDILFLNEAELDSVGNLAKYVPRVKNNFSRDYPYLYIYTEIYSDIYPTIVKLTYQFENLDEETEGDTIVFLEVKQPLTSQILKVEQKRIKKNNYKCIVHLERDSKKVIRTRNISFYWVNIPETDVDLDLALRQMRYIITSDSLDYYEDKSLEEKKGFFERFWSRRDPNPNTEANELMEEYFSRVNYANREFSGFSDDGWLSDRGRILIKFGVPDDIERHPFEIDRYPYVIWRYYSLRKVFLFSDRTGFGDYRLDPRYQSEEYN